MQDGDGNDIAGIFGQAGACEVITPEGDELGLDRIIVTQGHGFPLHKHPGHHILYVLGGEGFLHVDGVDYEMRKGMSFYVPAEYPHAMRAAKMVRLRVLAIGFPHKHVESKDRMEVVKQ